MPSGELAKDVVAADFPTSVGWNQPPSLHPENSHGALLKILIDDMLEVASVTNLSIVTLTNWRPLRGNFVSKAKIVQVHS